MKQITIKTIPHNEQRYETVGDYFEDGAGLQFRVSDMKDETDELSVAIHELIEHHLCAVAGVDMKDIDDFDIAYEKARDEMPNGNAPCGCPIQDEPGNDEHAPYYEQHQFATEIEQQFHGEARWTAYDRKVNELSQE